MLNGDQDIEHYALSIYHFSLFSLGPMQIATEELRTLQSECSMLDGDQDIEQCALSVYHFLFRSPPLAGRYRGIEDLAYLTALILDPVETPG